MKPHHRIPCTAYDTNVARNQLVFRRIRKVEKSRDHNAGGMHLFGVLTVCIAISMIIL